MRVCSYAPMRQHLNNNKILNKRRPERNQKLQTRTITRRPSAAASGPYPILLLPRGTPKLWSRPCSSCPIRRRRSSPRSPGCPLLRSKSESPGTEARCRCLCHAGRPPAPKDCTALPPFSLICQLRPRMWFGFGWLVDREYGME